MKAHFYVPKHRITSVVVDNIRTTYTAQVIEEINIGNISERQAISLAKDTLYALLKNLHATKVFDFCIENGIEITGITITEARRRLRHSVEYFDNHKVDDFYIIHEYICDLFCL